MPDISRREEKKLVEDIKQGLEAAMHEYGLEASDIRDASHREIKLHKLLYLGVHWGEVDVQYSWHTYGPDLGESAPNVESFQPSSIGDLPTPYTPGVNPGGYNPPPSPYEYKEFYEDLEVGDFENIRAIVESQLYEFLREFYSEYAPNRYKDLYLHNVELQEMLWEDGTNIDLRKIDEDKCRKLGEIITAIHMEMSTIEELSDVIVPFMEFSDLLEDVYMKMSQIEESDITGNPERVIREIGDFYHEYAWKYVAEKISTNTVHGINKNKLKQGALGELDFLENQYDGFLEDLEEFCGEVGVLPSPQDYPPEDDGEWQDSIKDLNSHYDSIE